MNGEKPPVTNQVTFLVLPNDLLLNCLARVSRLYYPTLSLVCKSFRSLLVSLELYETRTLLGHTESCLYLCLEIDLNSTWFTLCQRPIQITNHNPNPNPKWSASCFAPYRFLKNFTRNKEKKLSENFFVSVPTRNLVMTRLITTGYNIYKVGVDDIGPSPSSKVLFMDCRSHTWHEAPSMQMARSFPTTNVLDGKIYVVGGNKDCDSSNWMEYFDPKTQVWEFVQSPYAEIEKIFESVVIDGNLYLCGNKCVVYKPKENTWIEVDLPEMYFGWYLESYYVAHNIFYCLGNSGKLKWYDSEGESWRVLKGLKKLPKLPRDDNRLRLVDYGANIAVLWENEVGEGKEIWCAEISLERRNGQEIRGKIEWCDVVLRVPKSYDYLEFLSVMNV